MINKQELDLEQRRRKEQAKNIQVGSLCRVEKFDAQAMTVDVQPLSKALDAGVYRSRPPINHVPVALIRGGGFVLRPWYKAGDVGVLVYMDHDIDRIMDSGQECEPNTERNHAEEDAVFIGAFVPSNNPVSGLPSESLVMATEGGGLYVAVKKSIIEIKGDVLIKGNVEITENLGVDKVATGVQDVVGNGISLSKHVHAGCKSGTTGTPQ